jgi:hypothetical protein
MCLGIVAAGEVIALVTGQFATVGQDPCVLLTLGWPRKGPRVTQASTLWFSKAARPSAGIRYAGVMSLKVSPALARAWINR